MGIAEKIGSLGIVPVIKLKNAENAVPLCRALAKGGLPVAEITFRTEAAEESIRRVSAEMPDILVGAGTVLTCEQADRAIAAGAKFIVSPGLNPDVVRHVLDKNVPIFPGCATASDIERAIGLGLKVVKFFPAEAMGGIATIKALSGPYGDMRFMPTGGVSEKNLNDYLAFGKVLACGGSWMAKDDLIDAGRFDEIENMTRVAVQKMLGFEILRVGLVGGEELAAIFGGQVGEKLQGATDKGCLTVGCNSLARAKAYLQGVGVELLEGSDCLKREVGGLRVQLVQK